EFETPPSRSRRGLTRWSFDVRYALRQLRAAPFFTLVAVASIAVAIASNTLAFSIVNALLLRDPGFGDSEHLVEIYTGSVDDPQRQSVASWPIADDIRGFTDLFEGVVGYEPLFGRMLLDGSYLPVFGEVVGRDFFDVLDVPLALGRGFTVEDERLGTGVAVLAWETWQSRFDGRRDALGTEIEINGEPVTVVGVAPESFRGAIPALAKHVWLPRWTLPLGRAEASAGTPAPDRDRERWQTQLKGRLRPGVSAADAEAVLVRSAPELAATHPESYSEVRFRVMPTDDVALSPAMDGVAFSLAGGVMVVVALVLVIASLNLAGFLLARGADRWDELQLRQALGATRARLVGQLFIESLVLATAGGALGLALCWLALEAFARVRLPLPILLDFDFSIDRSVLLFTLGVTLVASLLFGLVPAWQSTRSHGNRGLAGGGGRRVTGSNRLRSFLLAVQVAVSLVFLVTGGLFTRSLWAETGVDPGFRTTNAAILTLELASGGYGRDELGGFLERMRSATAHRPRLESVAFTTRVPMGTVTSSADVVLPSSGTDQVFPVESFFVSPEYFEAMAIRLLEGRAIRAGDRRDTPDVVVVSRSFVQRFEGEGASLGATIQIDGRPAEIVGVVEDVRVDRPREGATPHLYRPLAQTGAFLLSVVGVTSGSSGEALRALRSSLDEVDRNVVVWSASTIEDHVSFKLMGPRIAAGLLVTAAAIALFLTVVGVFGSVSYATSRRAREMAIRLSLGATPGSVTRLVVLSMLRVIGVGAVVGLALSLAGTGVVRGLLYGVGPFDVWTFFVAVSLLATTAVLAALLPARRAGRAELVTILKDA
ncbi:MAG: ADOP family duplicated permease, partial [Gemmatimonadota bacterium]